MPVPTRLMSPPISTPSRSDMRTVSNGTSYTPTVVSGGGGHQKLNIVTRVAIEGKVKRGQDGASIRMFLKMSVPVDAVAPGSTIPLFQEENVKVFKSQVHPLDHNSAPYNFSSSLSPMLHNAARALNLPARLSQTFDYALKQAGVNGHSSAIRSSRSEHSDLVPPVDMHYTGQILVSGYSVAFVLPKDFLPRREVDDEPFLKTPSHSRARSEDEVQANTHSLKRRFSITERNQAQYMAAIDMWVPLLSKPPRLPFLLSIPTPRCLYNHIKLRIFPPHTTSTSFASLSSMEEDSNTWDLTSDPHVSRIPSRPSRTGSYTHFADDESSDTSPSGAYETCVIQGTFPSAQQIRVRWARPPRNVNIPGEQDALRRVGVEHVKGDMVCVVRGKAPHPTKPEVEGVLMDVEYRGECKGIWFPGVATMLGLDVCLVSRNSEVWWAPGCTAQWEVSGSTGFTGFDNQTPVSQGNTTRHPSIECNGATLERIGPDTYEMARTRTNSGSNASLLRAPLPLQNVEDYSFESSNATLPSGASSVSSLPVSSESSKAPEPCSTVVVHLNMNELQPSAKNTFDFCISGTIVVTPRLSSSRVSDTVNTKVEGPEPVTLPRFTVLAADNESTPVNIRNEVEDASVEVFQAHGDICKDPQIRKTVLQKNGTTRCGEEGGRIALKFLYPFHINGNARSVGLPRTTSNNIPHRSSRNMFPSRAAKREGPPMITSVEAIVTALTPGEGIFPDGYAVRVSLKTPVIVDSEWLEFGLSKSNEDAGSSSTHKSTPKVVLICASIDGIPVKAEMTKAVTTTITGGVPFDVLHGQEWIFWGKVNAAGLAGGNMVIDYLVKEADAPIGKGKKRMRDSTMMDILLPTFFISVARFEVKIEALPGLDISSVRSEFDYVRAIPEGYRLVLCSLREHAQPQLTLTIKKRSSSRNTNFTKWYFGITWASLLVVFVILYRLSGETEQLRKVTDGYSDLHDAWSDIPAITSTKTSGSGKHWLFGDLGEPSPIITSSSSVIQPSFMTPDFMPSRTMTETTTNLNHDYATSYAENLVKESSIAATSSPHSTYGLLPKSHIFAFTWSDQHIAALKHTLEKVAISIQYLYNVCRKLYHYPLDPP